MLLDDVMCFFGPLFAVTVSFRPRRSIGPASQLVTSKQTCFLVPTHTRKNIAVKGTSQKKGRDRDNVCEVPLVRSSWEVSPGRGARLCLEGQLGVGFLEGRSDRGPALPCEQNKDK